MEMDRSSERMASWRGLKPERKGRKSATESEKYQEMVSRWIEVLESGDETIIVRIQQTLMIDGMTKPSLGEIRNFLRAQEKPNERVNRN